MKKLLSCIIVFAFFFLSACEDNTMQPPKKQADQLQSPTSLEGTVWVHHPDTDPESLNWFLTDFMPACRTDQFLWPNGFNPEIYLTADRMHYHSIRDQYIEGITVKKGNGWNYWQPMMYNYNGTQIRVAIFDQCTCTAITFQDCTCPTLPLPILRFVRNLSDDGNTMYLYLRETSDGIYLYGRDRDVVLIRVR